MHRHGEKRGITDKTISWADEGRRRQLHEIGKPGFLHEERTSEMKAGEEEPLESRPETSTLTALRPGSSSRGETHVLAAFSRPAMEGEDTEHSCRQNYTGMGRQGWVWCLDGQNVVLGRSLRFVGISANSQSWFALIQWSPNVQREDAHEKRALPITHWPCGLRRVF